MENQKFLDIWYRFSKKGNNGQKRSYNSNASYGNGSNNRNYYKYERGNATGGNTATKKKNNPKSGIQYCYYHCPECKQQLRVPAGKGKVRITCPNCKNKFELNTQLMVLKFHYLM